MLTGSKSPPPKESQTAAFDNVLPGLVVSGLSELAELDFQAADTTLENKPGGGLALLLLSISIAVAVGLALLTFSSR